MDQTLFGEQIANSIIKDNSQLRFLVSKIHVYIVRKRRVFQCLKPYVISSMSWCVKFHSEKFKTKLQIDQNKTAWTISIYSLDTWKLLLT